MDDDLLLWPRLIIEKYPVNNGAAVLRLFFSRFLKHLEIFYCSQSLHGRNEFLFGDILKH